MAAYYRLRIDWTWSTTAAATTAATAMNTTLAAQGRAERASAVGARINLLIEPVATQAAAAALRDALLPNWNTGTRTAGKASVVLRDESST